MEILRVENLSFTYPSSESKSLDGVNLSIDRGEFVVICGHSGCGKTTLLRMMKKQLFPFGEKEGRVLYMGQDVAALDERVSSREIGFVLQDPESQIVTDKVWHELSFGLENVGAPKQMIRRRIAEISSYFGIEDIFDKDVSELSGGQKQLLNLASVMAMDPKLLILDEPTSQLDPIAAGEFISTLKKINRERSVTVILVEHRLEDVISEADKLVVMKDAKIIGCGSPEEVCRNMEDSSVVAGLPVPVRFYRDFPVESACPLSVKECKTLLENNFMNEVASLPPVSGEEKKRKLMELKDVSFRYEKDGKDVLSDLSLDIFENEVLCILGGNASGKTTLLKIISSILKPYRGTLRLDGEKQNKPGTKSPNTRKIAYLAQNPNDLFIRETVKEDFDLVCGDDTGAVMELCKTFGVEHALGKHPYDLSYGELQRCAIVKILLTSPDVIVLDEPTKGIDAFSKSSVKTVIDELKQSGKTIVIATHDTEFAAECADRCAFLFSGEIVSCESPGDFFSQNVFYTTSSSRISRDMFVGAVTLDELVELCRINGRK